MITTLLLSLSLSATPAAEQWELRITAQSNGGPASERAVFPTKSRCEAAGRVIVAFLDDGEATKGLGVKTTARCVRVSGQRP